MASTKIAAAQIRATLGDVTGNLELILEQLHTAAEQGVQLVVFPEAITSGYMFDDPDEARKATISIDGPEVAQIAAACGEGLYAVLGILETGPGDAIFNTALLVSGFGVVGVYRKHHLPFLGVDRFVTPGTEATPAVFATAIGHVGLAICYDIRFPESARALALAGADIIAQPAVWPDSADIIVKHIVRARAAENHVFLVPVSRGDVENGDQYRGNSQIIDPKGNVLTLADKEEILLTAEVDLNTAAEKRMVIRPGEYELSIFTDRRPELYHTLINPAIAER
jgi:5-aminopentanamidase